MADQIVVSESALGYLNATRPWVKFLSIVGFILTGLMILFGLIGALVGAGLPGQPGGASLARGAGFLYLLLAFLYLMPCLYLLRYARAISDIPGTGQAALEEALKNQKSFWKFAGIMTIVMLCLYLLALVFMVYLGAAMQR